MKIVTTFGGPCIYKQGIMPNRKKTGIIQYTGQTKKQLKKELIKSIKTGRNDIESFVNRIIGK